MIILKTILNHFCVECKICLLQLIGSSLNRLTNSLIVKLEKEKVWKKNYNLIKLCFFLTDNNHHLNIKSSTQVNFTILCSFICCVSVGLKWYKRDNLMTYIDQLKYLEFASNKGKWLREHKVVNFNIIDNACRWDQINKSIKEKYILDTI